MSQKKSSKSKKSESSKHSKSFPLYNQLFKDVYAFKEHAIELIKAMLSEAEVALLDLKGIRLESESFTKGLMGDLLFTVPLKDFPHIRIPLFILFEHKSLYSPRVLIQILGYMFEIIDRFCKLEKKSIIPPLIAVLFVHGSKKVRGPLSLQDLLPKDWRELLKREKGSGPFSSLTRDMVNFNLRVYNVHDPKNQVKWGDWKTRMALYLFRDKDLLTSKDEKVLEQEMVELLQGLKNVEDRDTMLSAVYFHLSQRNVKITLDFFRRCLVLASERDDKLFGVQGGKMGTYVPMTERGRREGLQIGRQEGILAGREEGILAGREEGILAGREEGILAGRQEGLQAGRQEGLQEGIRTVAYKLLQQSIEIPSICQATGLSKKQVLALKKGLKPS